MSIDFGSWLAGGASVIAAQAPLRAQIQAERILDKPESVSFFRNGVSIAAQTVRIEWTESLTEANSDLGTVTLRRGYIMGFKGHPTLPDLDVEKWDTFRLYDNEYTVTSVNYHLIGQKQASFESV
jgi:hypothetical protein